jgi:hypothetical protein
MTPGIQAEVDDFLARQRAAVRHARQHYNLLHHGLPVALGVMGALAVGLALGPLRGSAAPAEQRCGVGVAEQGDGQSRLLDRALGNAGISGDVNGYDKALEKVEAIDPSPQPGDRIVVRLDGNTVNVDSIEEVTDPAVNSCVDLATPSTEIPQS